MTAQVWLSVIGGAGFLAGVAGLLQFFNTRRSTKDKSSADAYQSWRTFMTGAVDDAAKVNSGLMAERDRLYTVRAFLIALVQQAVRLAVKHGAKERDVEPINDRLDEVRAM